MDRSIGFENLDVWKEARVFKSDIFRLTKQWPIEEKYDLISQIRRSTRSVCANIAEGYGRYYFKENIVFCRKSRGSLLESLNHLIDAYDSGYITSEKLEEYRSSVEKNIKDAERIHNLFKEKKC